MAFALLMAMPGVAAEKADSAAIAAADSIRQAELTSTILDIVRQEMNHYDGKGKNYNWLMWAVYIAVLLVCAGFGTYFGLTADLSQLLTFDHGKLNVDHSMLMGFAVLVGITGFTVWQIYQLASESDK